MRLAWLFAGALIGWILLPTPLAVCGVYNSAALPAWVQAIGSVAAILVAAGIPWWQERIKRREESKQLSIATLRLRSNLEVLGTASGNQSLAMRYFDVETATPPAATKFLQSLQLSEANSVTTHVDNVHHFEERIQEPILQLLEELDQFNTEFARVYNSNESEKLGELAKSKSGLTLRLQRISQLSFKASTAIRLVDEEKKYPDIRARNIFLRNIARRQSTADGSQQ